MKALFLLYMLTLPLPDSGHMNEVRYTFHHIETGEQLNEYIELLNTLSDEKVLPYHASAIMQKAKYVFLPTQKLKYFNKGKQMLDQYIDDHPADIESRYVRFIVQNQVPAFLGYSANIEEDRDLVLKSLDESDLPDAYKQLMRKTISELTKTH